MVECDDKNGCDDSWGDECHGTGHEGAVVGSAGNVAFTVVIVVFNYSEKCIPVAFCSS